LEDRLIDPTDPCRDVITPRRDALRDGEEIVHGWKWWMSRCDLKVGICGGGSRCGRKIKGSEYQTIWLGIWVLY
jgi:hypothetical protein